MHDQPMSPEQEQAFAAAKASAKVNGFLLGLLCGGGFALAVGAPFLVYKIWNLHRENNELRIEKFRHDHGMPVAGSPQPLRPAPALTPNPALPTRPDPGIVPTALNLPTADRLAEEQAILDVQNAQQAERNARDLKALSAIVEQRATKAKPGTAEWDEIQKLRAQLASASHAPGR